MEQSCFTCKHFSVCYLRMRLFNVISEVGFFDFDNNETILRFFKTVGELCKRFEQKDKEA